MIAKHVREPVNLLLLASFPWVPAFLRHEVFPVPSVLGHGSAQFIFLSKGMRKGHHLGSREREVAFS